MTKKSYSIAFFGSSLVSAYWNGAATYYRGIIKALHQRGHRITFFEPNAFDRQKHRDIPDPEWAEIQVYEPTEEAAKQMLLKAKHFDIVVKANGVGVLDAFLEREILNHKNPDQLNIFWDVDAPATLAAMKSGKNDELLSLIPDYDLILTYGGGKPVIETYESIGARKCVPVYNALDTDTHHPVAPEEQFRCDLGFLGNRLPDRESRVEEFFLKPAEYLPNHRFILGGSGWDDKKMPPNVNYVGHVYTANHNAFNASAKAVLNISRDSMAENGFSPATRVFEAAGAGACLITDYWIGIEEFLEPDKEVLIAESGEEVIKILDQLTGKKAKAIGKAALKRVQQQHTYTIRAKELEKVLEKAFNETSLSHAQQTA